MIVLIALVAIILVMQTQMLMMLQDLQASLFGNYDWYSSSNPLPPARETLIDPGLIETSNPLPPALVK